MKENNRMLNEIAVRIIIRFLRRQILLAKSVGIILNYHFDLPQFEIDLCTKVDELLVEFNCPTHLSWTARFTCRGRSTVDRNTKKHLP